MTVCQVCGLANPVDHRFCGGCGEVLPVVCPSCGQGIVAGHRFCGFCGAGAADAPPAMPAAAPSGPATPIAERRVCAVLFCDLVGFTPLSESRDPEEVRELLSAYFETARSVIGRYGGAIEKFIGDAVVAIWGAPSATEADSERAVRAALDLVAAVTHLGEEVGAPGLAARAGVVTGEVAVTVGATQEGMVAGDAVNTASRVQSAAGAGTVLVDARTQRLASDAIGFELIGDHTLKGKAEPQPLWQATRILGGSRSAQRLDGLEAPMIGRDAELRMARELFHAALERRTARLVVVSGPAGVGKSRLGWEFEKYVDGLAIPVAWHRGRCLSYGGAPFWALAEIVRQRLGIGDEEPLESATAKLLTGVAAHVAVPDEQVYVGLRLGRLLGVPFPGDDGASLATEELFAGWRLFFERLSDRDPVALLVEDAQYADSSLLDFLDDLVDRCRERPIYVVVFTRPDLDDVRPGFGVGRNRINLALDPLDPVAMIELVNTLVPTMPVAARTAIIDQAHGIPLYAVETVRALIDRDIVQRVEGSYRLIGDVGDLPVPDSLHGLLASRLDQLAPQVRQLVGDAAVLGSSFPLTALISVSGVDEASVRSALADLVHREVLDQSADPLSPDREIFTFCQELLRQVAYATLSRRDRKQRHLSVATHLRSVFANDGEEVIDVIARHYLDAMTAIPSDDDLEQIRTEAVAAFTRAAELAKRTGVPARAATSYVTAAELIEATSEADAELQSARLWELAGSAASYFFQPEAATKYAERARSNYLKFGDKHGAARALVIVGMSLRHFGRFADARDQLAAAVVDLRDHPDSDLVEAMFQLCQVEVGFGSPEAERLSSEMLTLGQFLRVEDGLLSRLLCSRGIWCAQEGRLAEAVMHYREAARLAEQAGNVHSAGYALNCLSDALAGDDPSAAVAASEQAVQLLRRTATRSLTYAIGNLAVALLEAGDWDSAERVLTDDTIADELPDAEILIMYQAWLLALRGDTESADRLTAGLTTMTTSDQHDAQASLHLVAAVSAAAARQPADALQHARAALTHVDAMGISAESLRWAWPLAARAAHELHDLDATQDLINLLDVYQSGQLSRTLRAERRLAGARLAVARHDPEATTEFASAIDGLRDLATPYHLAHGLLDHGEYLLTLEQHSAANALADEAREIAERLRCQPLLDRSSDLALAAR